MTVSKPSESFAVEAYQAAWDGFDLEALKALFDGDFDAGINACIECCDRYAVGDKVALDWTGADGRRELFTFAQLKAASAQFANYLTDLGIGPGDVVAGLLPRTPELVVTILGTWRAGAVYQPLFTAFGGKAIEHRLGISRAKLVVTDRINRPKLDEVTVEQPPRILRVAPLGEPANGYADPIFHRELSERSDRFEPVLRNANDLFLLMSTSGTTGLPKGVPVPLFALAAFRAYMKDAVGLNPDDTFWNIADPGWAYGLYYGITGPLSMGCTTLLLDAPFTVESAYNFIRERGVTNLAGAPTAYRLLMAAGPEAAAAVKGHLRVVSSAGEPLNAEVFRWFREHLDAPIYDHYGQTETGMVVNNHHRLEHSVRGGSAGFAMPGYRVAVLDEQDQELPPGKPGILAVDIAKSPILWFTGYWQKDTPALRNGYYLTGDTVMLEQDGSISFVGRSDDIITSSGYRIGPFDVESALIEHPAVMEAAVIGKPDPERTEIVKAFIVLNKGFDASDALSEELAQYVKKRMSAHAYPREITFMDSLPKTPSGKVQRFMLREQA